MTTHRPLVVVQDVLRIIGHGRAVPPTSEALRRRAGAVVEDLAAAGVVHAELRFAPLDHLGNGLSPDQVMAAVHAGLADIDGLGCEARLIVSAVGDRGDEASCDAARLAIGWMGERVVGVELSGDQAAAAALAVDAGLAHIVRAGDADGVDVLRGALDHAEPDRLGPGWRLIADCVVEQGVVDHGVAEHGSVDQGRIVDLGPTAARVRDGGIPIELGADHRLRALFDAGFRVLLNSRQEYGLAAADHGFTDVELAACAERAAGAALLPDEERERLVAAVADGWSVRPARLVHLAERDRWDAARGRGSYLPAEWEQDGFIHLSSLHQVLTPANRFYRGRTDLVALVVDAHLLGSAVVWEPGTGTVERFPHLYSAITPDVVLAEVPISAGPDGGFLLPPALMRAVRSPLGR